MQTSIAAEESGLLFGWRFDKLDRDLKAFARERLGIRRLEDVEDFIQSAYLVALEAVKDPERRFSWTWFTRTLRNLVLNQHRRDRAHKRLVPQVSLAAVERTAHEPASKEPGPLTALEREEIRHWLEGILERLDPRAHPRPRLHDGSVHPRVLLLLPPQR